MWLYIIISFVVAFIIGFFIAKKTIKPKTVVETKTIEVEVPPADYNEYLNWKQNYPTENAIEIVSDELYSKIETIINNALNNKFPEVEKEDTSTKPSEIKTIKAKVKRNKT